VQNLISQPPFSRLDLVSCRNVLIYLEAEIQRRIITLFSFALGPGGYLFLGKSDGIAGQNELFATLSPKWRIYRSQGPPQRAMENFLLWPGKKAAPGGALVEKSHPPLNLTDLNLQVLAKHFDAAIVLTDERGNILYFCGPTRKYLDHPTGQANLNLLNMIETEFSARLRLMLRSVAQKNEPATLESVPFRGEDSASVAKVTIMPAPARKSSERFFAVIFEDVRGSQGTPPGPVFAEAGRIDDSLIAQLEAELKALKDEFRSSIDEYESSAEELKAANEEIMSINEELQSTNEELETSKEEIQAVNEELNTVNNELNLRMAELKETNDDLANLLNASDIGTIFLDSAFCIKRFTPSAQKLLNLIPADLGRPIRHLSHSFIGLDLVADAEKVVQNLSVIEKEIQTSAGQWYEMHCLPYRTLENKIDGVVFTFTDVTRLKHSEEAMMEARDYAESIVETVREPLVVLDDELRVISANRSFYSTFQVLAQDTVNRIIYDLGDREWDIPRLHELLEKILPQSNHFTDFEVEQDFSTLGPRIMLLNARRIQGPHHGRFVLLAIEDITERRRAELTLRGSEERLRKETEQMEQQLIASGRLVSLGEITASMAHEFNNPLGIVMGFIQDLLEETDASHPNYRALKIMDEESRRCRKIIQDLMEYARPRSGGFDWIEVKDVIEKTLSMVQSHLYKRNVQVINEAGPDVPKIYADAPQLEQVLLNLYLNAIDAMPEGGTLTVGIEVNSHPADETGRPTEVMITVADTGIGIESGDLPKIFQPFLRLRKRAG